MTYSIRKTAVKTAAPLLVVILVKAAYAALASAGITVDETVLWTVATGGYAALVGFINWLKHHKNVATVA